MYLQHWHGWWGMNLLPSRCVLCTPYIHAPCHFMQRHTHKVNAYLAVTCHLHFWQNDRFLVVVVCVFYVLLRQHGGGADTELRVSTESRPWRRQFSPQFLLGLEPATFQSRVRHSNYWAVPADESHYMAETHESQCQGQLQTLTVCRSQGLDPCRP